MLRVFQEHIDKNFPELRQEQFLLACSGGLDSVVLAALCERSNLNFAVAHCNFQLRGGESDADEQFVKNLVENYRAKFYVTKFDTVSYVNDNKVSVQMAARELRYIWFADIMQQNKLKIVVTAHHADDNLETFLINLSRGTGIDGLSGIPEKNNGIHRPMLPFSRAQIAAYAKSEHIEWREDASNKETKYLRNAIRHKIVPLLKELHPTFLENFNKTQGHLDETKAIVKTSIESLKKRLFVKENEVITIPIVDLLELHPQKTFLYELFKDYGFTAWGDIVELLTGTSGKEVRSKTHRLVKDREVLLLVPITTSEKSFYRIGDKDTLVHKPIGLHFEEVSEMRETSKNVLYVDKETLKYPLTVRKWQNGDYFYPLGMQGKKKLSKYFKDEKIDVVTKENQWLLYSENQLVWVIGRRADNRFRIKEGTKNILKITWNQ